MTPGMINPMNAQMVAQFQQFRQNPVQFLISRNVNIPQQFQNDYKGAVQYLLTNGQMSQNTYNNLSQMVMGMGGKLV